MKILDCTLRDGGHAVDFDWPLIMAREYYTLMCDVGVDVMELGYWGQTDKSKNMFYNLDMKKVGVFAGEKGTCSVMVDYHHCNHDYSTYPKLGNGIVDMIRVCVRKQDIVEGMAWATGLKEHTGLTVSFNAFNLGNYSEVEIESLANKVRHNLSVDYIYFADTHGSIDLSEESSWTTTLSARTCQINGRHKVGLHFHDHLGRAYQNYKMADEYNASIVDSTLLGIGKGAGNLHTEHIIAPSDLPAVLEFMDKWDDHLRTPYNPYYTISAVNSVCEAYAVEAQEKHVGMRVFDAFCRSLTVEERDVYERGKL